MSNRFVKIDLVMLGLYPVMADGQNITDLEVANDKSADKIVEGANWQGNRGEVYRRKDGKRFEW